MAWICDKNGNHRCEIKKLTYNGTFMEVSSITVTVESPAPIAFAIGDYIDWDYDGLRYTLDTAAGVEKQATRNSVGNAFIYENLVFLSPLKAAENADFFDVILDNTNDFLTNTEFSFYGTAWDYAKRLEANLCRLYGSGTWKVRIWTSGTCYDATPATGIDTGAWENKLVDVAGIKCLGGFQQIYDLWGCAYVFSVVNGVNYVDFYDDFEQYAKTWQEGGMDKIFAYGKGNGLYKIRHTPDADHVLVTRLRPYGSGDNLPPNYYLNSEDYHVDGNESSELAISHLMLPASEWTKDGVKHPANAFLEQNTDLYGVREGVVLWDGSDPELGEIKPSIYGLTIQDLLNLMASGDSYRPDEAKWPDTTQRIDKIITGAAPVDNGVKNEAGYDFTEVESIGSLAEHSFGTGGAYIDVEFNDLVMGTTPSVSHLAEFRIVPTSENKVAASFDVQASVASAIRAVNAYLTPYVGGVKISDATYPCTVTEEAISNTVEGITYTKRYKISLLDSTGNPIVFSSMYTGDVTFRIVAHIDFIGNPTGFPVVRNEYAVSFNLLRGNKAIDEYFSVTIPQIGFDLSAAVANGAKLCMRSGANQPREFQIIPSSVRYLPDTDTWFVRCKRSVDQSISTYFPNSNSVIAAGDEYYFTGIAMPPLYVEIAAQKLLTAATAWLALHSKPRMLSAVDVDNKVMAVEEIVLKEGMSLPLSDTDLGITPQNQESRVIDNIRIEEGSDPIRTFTITLRDKKEKSSLDAAIRGATSNLATNASVSEAVNAATGTGHGSLTGRDMPNQHPISAITGLEEALLSSGFFEYDPVSDVVKLKSDYDYLGPKKGLIFTENAEENTPAELMKVNVGTAQNPVWALRSRLPFFSDSWVSAGGVSEGGGSPAVDLQAVWASLEGNDGYGANRVIDSHHIPVATSDAVGGIKIGYEENGRNYAVKLSDGKAYVTIPWVDQEPIAPLADAIGDVKTAVKGIGESIVDLSMNVDGLHAGLMELADEDLALLGRIETLADYFDASGNAKSALKLTTTGPLNIWGVQFWNNGIPNAVTDQPYLYIAKTRVKTSAANDTLLGINGWTNTGSASTTGDKSKVEWDSDHDAWHFIGNVYADGWVSAGGLSSGGGQASGNASLSNVTTLAHGQTGELSASGVGNLVLYDKDAIDYMIANAGQVKKVAGISPDSLGDIPVATLKTALGLGDAAYRGVATSVGAGVTGLVPGSLLQSILGDGTWDSTNTVKQFVNSSIQTATAIYQGSYNLVTDLSLTTSATQAQIGTALASAISGEDNNDYAFVQIPTSDATPTEIARTDRYKFNGTSWVFEYSLNNSGYTAAQWAAINSGITAGKVTGYDTIAGYFTNGIISTSNLPSLYIGTTAVQYTSQQQDLAGIGAFTMANGKHLSILDANGTARSALFMTASNDLYVGRGMPDMSTPGKTYIYGGAVILATGANRTTAVTVASNQNVTLANALYFNNSKGIYIKDNPSEGTATYRETFALNSDNILRIGYGIRGTGYTGRIYGGRAYNIYLDDASNSNAARYVINYACIRPALTSAYDLGAATITWRNAYIDTIYEGSTSLVNKYHPKGGDNALAFVASTVSASTSVTAPKFYLDANTYFELDSDGYVHLVTPTGKGFYADGFISAGGLSTGGGSTGIDEAAMWAALQRNSGEGLNKQIHNKHLPTCGTGLSYTLNSDGIATAINVAFPVTSVAGKTGAVTLAVSDITDFPTTWAWANITGAPSTMPSPYALTFGSKTYDGSAAKTITASDLGALTSVAFSDLTSHPTNLSGYGITDAQPLDDDLTAIAELTGTNGFLKKTTANTWTLDTNTYLTASTVPEATSSAFGGIKIGYTESNENYAVQLSSGKAYVHVADSIPYSDAIGDVKSAINGLGETIADLSMGIDSIIALLSNPTIEAIEFKLYGGAPVMTWDETNQAWHLNGNFYADGFVSAGGVSDGGGSEGATLEAVWGSLVNGSPITPTTTTKIAAEHIPDMASAYGYIKSVSLSSGTSNGTLRISVDGVSSSDVAVTGLGNAAYRGIASTIGSSVNDLVSGSLLYGVLGEAFDETNTVKAFVNSSIATATATFRGTNTTATTESAFLTWANALTHNLNDYVFWKTTDSAGNVVFKRYKYGYDGTEAGSLAWRYEYDLNNSSFTAAQWSAINSGITATKVGNYDTIAGYFTNGLLSASHVGDLSGTYLPLTGGTLSGNLTINHAASGGAMFVYKNGRANSSGGGWNDHVISIADSSGTEIGRLGIYGAGAALNYFHLGLNAYNGDNLRVYADRVQFGGSTIYHSGNSNLTTVDWKARNMYLPNGAAICMADNPSEGSATNRAVLNISTGNVLRIGYGIRTTEYHTQIYGGNRIRFATAISGATADRFLMLGNDFYPNATEVSDLGIASRYWNNAYIKTIYENGTSLAEKYHPKGGDSSLNFAAAAIEATSFKLASGTPTLTWDGTNSAWHLSGNFYADGWVSAGGVSNGGGSTGIDEAAMWVALGRNSGDGLGKQIHSAHLPTLSAAGGLTAAYSGVPDSVSMSIGIDSSHYLPTTTDQSNWNAKVAPADLGVQIIELTDSGSTTAGTWVASSSKITALTDGMMVRYKITVAGASNTYLNVNGLGAKRVYRYGSTKLTTHYSVGEYVTLYYCANLNSGCWECVDGYDATVNNVRQYITSSNVEYPLLFRYNTGSTETYVTEYTRFASAVTLNPSTGTITANAFKVTNGTSGGFLKANGSVDTNTYLTGNQTITLSGDVSGSGTTSISVTIGAKKVAKSMLAQAVQNSLDKADTALQSFTETDPTVPSWAKASSKPSYNLDEVGDGSTRKLSNYLPLAGGTMSNTNVVTNLNADLVDGENASAFAHRGAANNLLVAGNEFNFISAGFSGGVYINFQDENRQSAASVSSYIFCNGRGGSFATLGASGSSFGASISVTGQISSTGDQIITSDETKKMNLEDINLSVGQVASVRAVTFDFKADGRHSFGTIAQDWKKILPEAVLGEEGDYSFAYAQAAMVSSIINARAIVDLENHETEQDKEIKRLRERVNNLEAEIKRLRAN